MDDSRQIFDVARSATWVARAALLGSTLVGSPASTWVEEPSTRANPAHPAPTVPAGVISGPYTQAPADGTRRPERPRGAEPWSERQVLHWAHDASEEVPTGGHLAAAWVREEPPLASVVFIDQGCRFASADDPARGNRGGSTIESSPLAMPGAPVTLVTEPRTDASPAPAVLYAFFVGTDGAVYEARASVPSGAASLLWGRPRVITSKGFAPDGAKVAAVALGSKRVAAFVVGVGGELQAVTSADAETFRGRPISTGRTFAHGVKEGGAWRCAPSASAAWSCANPGAALLSGSHDWLVVSAVDQSGAFDSFISQRASAEDPSWGPWTLRDFNEEHPGSAGVFPSTADVTSAQQYFYQVDSFVVDAEGRLNVLWMQEGPQVMHRAALSGPGYAPPGAWLAATCEVAPGPTTGLAGATPDRRAPGCAGGWLSGQLDVAVVGNNGALDVFVPPYGGAWLDARADESATRVVSREMPLVRAGIAPGTPIAAAHRTLDSVEALVAGASAVERVITAARERSPSTRGAREPPADDASVNVVYQVF